MTMEFDEKGKFFTDIVPKIPIPATIQTLTHRVEGHVHVREGERIKDTLNKSDTFLAVTDAQVFDSAGEFRYHCDFLAINLHQVVWVNPAEELQGENDA